MVVVTDECELKKAGGHSEDKETKPRQKTLGAVRE